MSLRSQLSKRLRLGAPAAWGEFSRVWMAFNAIYGGDAGGVERDHVMNCIRDEFSDDTARRVLGECAESIDRIVAIPPGNMRRGPGSPNFRTTAAQLTATYRDQSLTATERLAAVGGVLYQVRCNHDPWI
jgi:hypothetical protein